MFRPQKLAKSLLWVLAAVLIAGSWAEAQDREGRRRGRGGFGRGPRGPETYMLLLSAQVQKELKLSEEQVVEIQKVADETRQAMMTFFAGFRDLSREEREEKREEMREKRKEMTQDIQKKIDALMTDAQKKRFGEIRLQAEGIRALVSEKVTAALKVTEVQRQSVRDLIETQREMQRELFRARRGLNEEEREAKMAELRELNQETQKAAMEILSEEQRTQFAEMKGEAFELDRRALFGGRRFGRGRGEPGEGRRGRREGRRRQRPETE